MKNILIVDDSATLRRMILASLRGLPQATFTEAGSGLEAIERLALAPVDLVFLDLNMPDMHGLEVLRFVRAHESYRHIPIIVLTTKGDDATRGEVIKAGATLFLTKPFQPATLAATAQQFLQAA